MHIQRNFTFVKVSRQVLVATALLVAFLTSMAFVHSAKASHTATDAFAMEEFGPLRLKSASDFKAAAGISFGSNENGKTLTSIAISFTATSGSPTWTNMSAASSELLDLATTNGGISLWKETTGLGFSSSQDTQVTLAAMPQYGASNTFTITPATSPTLATEDFYYIVLKSDTAGLTNNNAFTLNLAANAITTSSASPTINAFSTQPLIIDTVAPSVSSTNPANNATNVPVSALLKVTTGEEISPTSFVGNVTLTRGGTAVPFTIHHLNDGFEVVPSNPPTFASGSRVSSWCFRTNFFIGDTQCTNGFYPISGTNPINIGGFYQQPLVGDIVFFSQGSSPGQFGVITNATKTSGTFAINDIPLAVGHHLTFVAAPNATGLVTATTALTTGDLVFVNTSANPTAQGYGWHIVSTAAAVSNAALRLDNAGAAPTYVAGSRFSKITPAVTATDNGATSGGTLAVVLGDLVFARIGSSSYGWHMVTTAGNLSSDATENTAGLDGLTAANSLVAANSQISKVTPQRTVAATDTATLFNRHEVLLANATTNASPVNSFAFHYVSEAGTLTSLRLDNQIAPLQSSAAHTLTLGTGLTDKAGNALSSALTVNFTTAGSSTTNTTVPQLISSTPLAGEPSFPTNGVVRLRFSVPMATSGNGSVTSSSNVGIFADNNGQLGTQVTAANTYDSITNTVTITPAAALSAGLSFMARIAPTTLSATNIAMAEVRLPFRTAVGTDTTKPRVLGGFPNNGATGVPQNTPAICIGFSEDVGAASITANTLTVSPTVTGTRSYNQRDRQACIQLTALLAASTQYTVTVVGGTNGVLDLVGNPLDQDPNTNGDQNFTSTFTTGSALNDTTAPAIAHTNADNFGLAITFTEPMQVGGGQSAVDNLTNYVLESPVGTPVAIPSGATITYDGSSLTVTIRGLTLQSGNSLKVTVINVRDLSGNLISTTGTPPGNVGFCQVRDPNQTGGDVGPGGGGGLPAGQQFIRPVRVMPLTRLAGATTDVRVELAIQTQIPAAGSILLTFPNGFNVTNAALDSESTDNGDINGPMPGTVTIASVSVNAAARTVTLTLGGVASGANTFLAFDLINIVNSSIPNSAGYTVDIKTRDTLGNNFNVLESLTSQPFHLVPAGTRTLTVNVFNDNGAGGGTAGNNIKDGTEPAINNVEVILFKHGIGELFSTTDVNGVATMANLPDGTDYNILLDDESVLAAGNFIWTMGPQPLSITANTTKNFGLTAATVTIGGNITGPLNTSVDVTAAGGGRFYGRTVNTGGGGSVAYTLPATVNTTFTVNVLPALPDDCQRPNMICRPPVFNFVPPAPLEVRVAGASVTGQNFTLVATDKTITGTVTDANGAGVMAGVMARSVQASTVGPAASMPIGTMTNPADGSFTLNVAAGTYLVGVFRPGMPPVPERKVTVPTTGPNVPATLSFVLDASTTGLTISGKVTDDQGNPIAFSGVGARKVVSQTDTTAIGGDASNFVGGPTDQNGEFTLFVSAGTWIVEAFAPGFGKLGQKTVVVASQSVSGINFTAGSLNLGTITGQATAGGTASAGVFVKASGPAGENGIPTNDTGNYSLRLPAGTYTVNCFFPGIGESAPVTGVVVTGGATTASVNCAIASTITITVNITDGTNPITGAFVEMHDANGRGNGTNISTSAGANASYVVTVPAGTYTVRAMHPAYGPIGSTTGVNSTQTITYSMATSGGVLRAVSGTVTCGGTNAEGAWVSLTGTPTSKSEVIHVGSLTAANGTYTINVPNGSYKLRADKPKCKSPAEATVTVAGIPLTGQNITMTATNRTIQGTVTLSGSPVSSAWVDANDGNGGFAAAQTGANGQFTLDVADGTWVVSGHSNGYESGAILIGVSSDTSNVPVTLVAISGYIPYEETETVTPSSGGQVTTGNLRVSIPANALGGSSSAYTVRAQSNSGLVNPSTGAIDQKDAVRISATDNSGNPVTTLQQAVTITVPYLEANLPAGASEGNLVIGVWNDATQSYDTLQTTVDTTSNTLTATTTHFSDFAPLVPTDPAAPATPTGLAAANTGSLTVGLTWNAVSGASTYNVYRSTDNASFPLLASASSTSYTATGQPAGVTTYFKVSAVNTAGNESAASATVSIIPTGPSGGGGGSGTTPATGYTTLTVTLPNGGEVVTAGSPTNITWTSTGNGFSTVRIMLSADGGLSFSSTIVASTPANGSYRWVVPTNLSGTSFRVKIEGVSASGAVVIQDISDRNFEIRVAGAPPTTTPPPAAGPGAAAPVDGVTTGPRFDKARARDQAPNINADKGLTRAAEVSAVCASDTLVKGPSTLAVYYCGADGRRYVFMNEKVYFTWYTDFSGVLTISDADLARLPLAGVVTPRGGVRMVKIESDPKVYAIAPGGVLRWVTTEAIARALYGFDWNRQIDDIPVSLFARFTMGLNITE